jgi:hypothetical protein
MNQTPLHNAQKRKKENKAGIFFLMTRSPALKQSNKKRIERSL